MSDYKKKILTRVSEREAFDAIALDMTKWWGDTTSEFKKVGDVASVSFKNGPAVWTFEATKLEKSSLIELKCIDEDWDGTTEWIGTKLIFKIKKGESGAIIEFTHKGLNKKLECFDVCSEGWDSYLEGPLTEYLDGEVENV